MKLFVIAGEASGDLHASNLMKELKRLRPDLDFLCFGGDLMREAGGTLARHYRDMAFMGIWEVIRNYGKIRKNLADCKAEIIRYNPDAVILVDYAGFNLRVARFASGRNLRVFYYISPKLWAWGKWRIKKVRRFVERMFVNLPFEVDFYKSHGITAEYYGNPVVDSVTAGMKDKEDLATFVRQHALDNRPIIALLAGSRRQEIDLCLPEMLSVIQYYPNHQFVIAGAPSLSPAFYQPYIEGKPVHLLHGQTYGILRHATAAIVTSGTATLETALHRIPQVVIYKTSVFTFIIGWPFVSIKFFSLVNLIMDREVVRELLQFNLARDIKTELDNILFNGEYRQQMLDHYDSLMERTGFPGVSARVAERMLSLLHEPIHS